MPKIGLKGMWVAELQDINGVISYSNGRKVTQLNEVSSSAEGGDTNNFYSDNGICASDSGSSNNGELSYTTCGFSQEDINFTLGIKEEVISVGDEEVKELVYDDDAKPSYMGVGQIITKRKGTKDVYRAVVFTKVMFKVPDEAAKTREENIDFQPEEIEAVYMADGTSKNRWKREATFEKEEKAIAYIEHCLNIIGIGKLTVTSEPGTEIGKTQINVSPMAVDGNTYAYRIAAEVGLPVYDQEIDEQYTDWNGTEEITTETDLEILIVEISADKKAKKAGKTKIKTNEGA